MASFEHCMMDSREVSFIVHLLFYGEKCVHQHSIPVWHKPPDILAVISLFVLIHELSLNSRLELGDVLIIWGKWAAIANQTPITAIVKWTSAQRRSVLSFLQPLPFLFRQHISPHALFMQPRPLHTIQTTHTKKATHTHVSRLSHFVILPPFQVMRHEVGRTFLRHQFLMGRERYRTHDP